MSNWKNINKFRWLFSDNRVIGYSGGIGPYKADYVIHTGQGILNGRISADIKILRRHKTGAGLICRASDSWSFAAFYVAPDDGDMNQTVVRISYYKHGVFYPIIALKQPIVLDEGFNRFTLEFYSGTLRGEICTSQDVYEINYVAPHIPFAGYVGLIKFYSTGITAKNIEIQHTDMPYIKSVKEENMSQFKFDVFISHASKDNDVIDEIVKDFEREGISYWLDSKQIKFGDNIIEKIEDGLRSSRFVMPCLSQNLIESGWCRQEYNSILNSELSGDSSRIVVPLKLDNCSDDEIPFLLRPKKRASYSNKVEYTNFLKFLKK